MIPEYKRYHGALLTELVDVSDRDFSIGELREDGRLSTYIINQSVGLHIKHSTARLPPWQFTVTYNNIDEWITLQKRFPTSFLCLVCGFDGFVTLDIDHAVALIYDDSTRAPWIRVQRFRGHSYEVFGSGSSRSRFRVGMGVSSVIDAIYQSDTSESSMPA